MTISMASQLEGMDMLKKGFHPGLSWVKIEATTVKEDRGFEVFDILEPADTSFDRLPPSLVRMSWSTNHMTADRAVEAFRESGSAAAFRVAGHPRSS